MPWGFCTFHRGGRVAQPRRANAPCKPLVLLGIHLTSDLSSGRATKNRIPLSNCARSPYASRTVLSCASPGKAMGPRKGEKSDNDSTFPIKMISHGRCTRLNMKASVWQGGRGAASDNLPAKVDAKFRSRSTVTEDVGLGPRPSPGFRSAVPRSQAPIIQT